MSDPTDPPPPPDAQLSAKARFIAAQRKAGGTIRVNPHAEDPAARLVLTHAELVERSAHANGIRMPEEPPPPVHEEIDYTADPRVTAPPPSGPPDQRPWGAPPAAQTAESAPPVKATFDLGPAAGTQYSQYGSADVHGRFLVLSFREDAPYPSFVPPMRRPPDPPIIAYLSGTAAPLAVYNLGIIFPAAGRIFVVLPLAPSPEPDDQPPAGPNAW